MRMLKTVIGFTLLATAAFIELARADSDFSEGVCSKDEKKVNFTLPGAKNAETIEITFECDGYEIIVCQLPGKPRVLRKDTRRQDFVGADGRNYFVKCWMYSEPDVFEDYSANVCAGDDKNAVVRFSDGQKSVGVEYECDADSKLFKSCTPSGNGKISARRSALLKDPAFGGRYKFFCDDNLEATVELTFAAEICKLTKKKREFYVPWSGKLYVTVKFECNDDGNQIKSCKPNKSLIKVNAGKTSKYGGVLRKKFTLACFETDKPSIELA